MSNSYIFAARCQRRLIFQTMISIRSNNLSLKYQRFKETPSKKKELAILSLWQKLSYFAKIGYRNWN